MHIRTQEIFFCFVALGLASIASVSSAQPSSGSAQKTPTRSRTDARTSMRELVTPAPTNDDDEAKFPPVTPRGIGIASVVAEGVGSTADEALKDAFRAAVRQTLGSIVRSTTAVQDDVELINRITTFSRGFVEDYTILNTWAEAGFVHRKISAVVRTRELSMQVRAEKASVASNGRGLWPEVITKIERRKSAKAMFNDIMGDFPWSCLTAAPYGRPKVVQILDAAAQVSPTTRLAMDTSKLSIAMSDLSNALEALAQASGAIEARVVKPNPANYSRLESIFKSRFVNDNVPLPLAQRSVSFSSIHGFYAPDATIDSIYKKLNSLPDKSGVLFLVGKARRWNWYFVRDSIDVPRPSKTLAITFRDASGGTVAKRTIGLGPATPGISSNESSLDGKRFMTVFISPYFLDHAGTGMKISHLAGCVALTLDGEVGMSADEFRRVEEVTAALE